MAAAALILFTPLASVAALALGSTHACAVHVSGEVSCWGSNRDRALGAQKEEECLDLITFPPEFMATISCSTTPLVVCEQYEDATDECLTPLSDVTAVAAGEGFSCALIASGGVKCWGRNSSGQLGDRLGCGFGCERPVDVCADFDCAGALSGVAAIEAGGNHICGVMSDGSIVCWGNNGRGALADGTKVPRSTPVAVLGLSEADAVTGGRSFTCSRSSSATAQCWGNNRSGQLGIGFADTEAHPKPIDVLGRADKPAGDADCSGDLTSADALLLLQLDAGLIETGPCPVPLDVNDDGAVNSLDAVLVLQTVAGLLASP